jgi:hypothetical protein
MNSYWILPILKRNLNSKMLEKLSSLKEGYLFEG